MSPICETTSYWIVKFTTDRLKAKQIYSLTLIPLSVLRVYHLHVVASLYTMNSGDTNEIFIADNY